MEPMTSSITPSSPPSLPEGIALTERHDRPALVVDLPGTTAVIQLDGAHLTGWTPARGGELLWMSPLAEVGPGAAIRGGVPLVGPWFGPGRDGRTEPKHGWLRTAVWTPVRAEITGRGETRGAIVELALNDADPTGQGASAHVQFTVEPQELTVALTFTAGREPVELEEALHTYFAVSDVESLRLDGLAGADFLDNTEALARRHQDGEPTVSGLVDRIYEVADTVRIHDPAGRTIVVDPEGSSRTVLWNPGAQAAATMADVPDDGWPGFVCVESAVCKDGFVPLAPGQGHTLSAHYRIENRRA
jgi:glucose-6-phosphate 1-epimerase